MRKLLLLLLLFAAPLSANSLILDTTTKSLEINLSAAGSVDYIVSWADNTTTAFTPGMEQGNLTGSGDATIVPAPAGSTQRQIKWVSVRNRSTTAANVVQLQVDDSGTEYVVGPDVTLGAGESLRWDAEGELEVFAASGARKERSTYTNGYGGVSMSLYKAGPTTEAAGRYHAYAVSSGNPGAWSPGTPGLAGYNTDCSVDTNATNPVGASESGGFYLPDPASGAYYLTNFNVSGTQAMMGELVDVLWYDTGAVVTTTTGQTITMPGALPARDAQGTTAGEGVNAAILVTTATTQAGAVTTITLTYHNSDGTGSRTASIPSFPATAVAGTFVPFTLAAGDRGISSADTLTLGTTLSAGAISVVLYRVLAQAPVPTANVGSVFSPIAVFDQPGIRIWNDTCLWLNYLQTTTTAATAFGTVTIMER